MDWNAIGAIGEIRGAIWGIVTLVLLGRSVETEHPGIAVFSLSNVQRKNGFLLGLRSSTCGYSGWYLRKRHIRKREHGLATGRSCR